MPLINNPGLVDEQQVLNTLQKSRDDLNIVLTGRRATAGMIGLVDTVTEMISLKHALEAGIPAREGIEF